jgi:hypothetical protein
LQARYHGSCTTPLSDRISIPSYGRFKSGLEVTLIAEDRTKTMFSASLICERSQSNKKSSIVFKQTTGSSTTNIILQYLWHPLDVLKQLPPSPIPVKCICQCPIEYSHILFSAVILRNCICIPIKDAWKRRKNKK